MKRPKGMYRTRRPLGIEDDVWLDDGGIAMDIPESLYRSRGYEPDLDSLPWKDVQDDA